MTTRFTKLAAVKLEDPNAERARDSHATAIAELQENPALQLKVLRGIVLPNGTEVFVAHGLGRAPLAVIQSLLRSPAPLTAGFVIEYRGLSIFTSQPIDSAKVIVLAAFGFTNTITVDLVVL